MAENRSEEEQHFNRIVTALAGYSFYNSPRFLKALRDYEHFEASIGGLLPHFRIKIAQLQESLNVNQDFLDAVTEQHRLFENDEGFPTPQVFDFSQITEHDAEKVRSTLRQVVRDWTAEGKSERDQCYQPILQELVKRCPLNPNQPVRVLVPGAGLGRLVFEISKKGYHCQGNEFSYFMLMVSEFILNRSQGYPDGCDIYPFIHQFSNVWSPNHQLRKLKVPDIFPSDLPVGADMSMVAGDFLDVYRSQAGEWDCVVTCFFLDTAKNVIDYIRLIHKIIAPGGYWINLGPLLYHFEEMPGEASLELSYEELRHIIFKLGFDILEEEHVSTSYAANSFSMLNNVYYCIRFTAIKRQPYLVIPSSREWEKRKLE